MSNLDLHAAQLLQHLQTEEDLLRQVWDALSQIHTVLRSGDLAAVAVALPAHEALAQKLDQSQQARRATIEPLAAAVGVAPHEAALAVLVARLPEPWASQLGSLRSRLKQLTAEIEDLQIRNANLIAHLRSFCRGVIATLTGVDTPVRYGPSGMRMPLVAGRAIQGSG
jgi:flagellar biosynthesis/type III secretory pathway chaperone